MVGRFRRSCEGRNLAGSTGDVHSCAGAAGGSESPSAFLRAELPVLIVGMGVVAEFDPRLLDELLDLGAGDAGVAQ